MAQKQDGKYGLLRKDGTWAVEPKWSEIGSVEPINGYFVLKENTTRALYDWRGEPVGKAGISVAYAGLPGFTPVKMWSPVPAQGLTAPTTYRLNFLDAQGEPIWPMGRVRMVDNQFSFLAPEDWSVTTMGLGNLALNLSPTAVANRPGYPHQAQVFAWIVDRKAGEETPQVAARLVERLGQGNQKLKFQVLSSGAVGSRSWLQMKINEEAKRGARSSGFGYGAVTVGAHQAYAVFLWGVVPGFGQGEREVDALKLRFQNLLASVRFPGEEGF